MIFCLNGNEKKTLKKFNALQVFPQTNPNPNMVFQEDTLDGPFHLINVRHC